MSGGEGDGVRWDALWPRMDGQTRRKEEMGAGEDPDRVW